MGWTDDVVVMLDWAAICTERRCVNAFIFETCFVVERSGSWGSRFLYEMSVFFVSYSFVFPERERVTVGACSLFFEPNILFRG